MAKIVNDAVSFIRDVRSELTKVVWPDKKTTTTTSVAVGVFLAVTTVFLAGSDFVIAKLVNWILR